MRQQFHFEECPEVSGVAMKDVDGAQSVVDKMRYSALLLPLNG
jgi:hypothetical protein